MFVYGNIRKNFKDLDLAFVDTETSGRGYDHELLEIAVVRARGFDFSLIDEWETKIKPKHIETADPDSLKINHYNEADWVNAVPLNEAMQKFLEKTEDTILVAHNLVFDWYYIHKALYECNLKPTFWIKGLDTISLAWLKLRGDSDTRTLSMRELTQKFDIDQGKLHTALDDARTAYKLFLKIIEK